MKKAVGFLAGVIMVLGLCGNVYAHFGMLIPSDTAVAPGEDRRVVVTLSFSHPFEGEGMTLDKPVRFGMVTRGETKSLISVLEETKVMGHKAWKAQCRINRPGVYTFFMEPKPYWEPAENCYIVHYTKSVITAFGMEEGWEEPVGLKTEIVPLSRPFGLYAGNVFQGRVMLEGEPVPNAEVEVEYYNRNGKADAPLDCMITQSIRADRNGVFTYAVPRSGWWGFAALNTAKEKLPHDGEEKNVELGAVIWVKFQDWQEE